MNIKIYLILLLLLIPNLYAFNPVFRDSPIHYYGEMINLGITDDLPIDVDYFIISIYSKETEQLYFLQDISIYDKNNIYFVPSDIFSQRLIVNYKFYEEDDTLIEDVNYDLNLKLSDFSLNYVFCKDIFCFENSNYFVLQEDIFILNKDNIFNDVFYDIKIFNEYDNLILDLNNISLPYKLNLDTGDYFFEIYAKYKNSTYLFSDLYLTIIENPSISTPWESYFLSIDDNISSNLVDNKNTDKSDNDSVSVKNKKSYFIYLLIFIILIIISYFLFKPKNEVFSKFNSTVSRREKRHEHK
jgi:hypothetical protein